MLCVNNNATIMTARGSNLRGVIFYQRFVRGPNHRRRQSIERRQCRATGRGCSPSKSPERRRTGFGREDEGRAHEGVLDDAPLGVSPGMPDAGAGAGIGSDAARKMTPTRHIEPTHNGGRPLRSAHVGR